MKIKLQILLLLIPIFGTSQNLVKCNDSTSFLVNQLDSSYCYIKLTGSITETENSKVFTVNNYILQTILTDKNYYTSTGSDDISVLSIYILSEMQYYTGFFKEKLNVMMIPVEISAGKKAVIWYYDIPEKAQDRSQPDIIPAIKQVSISIVSGDYVYSIGTTQFKGQSLDIFQEMLTAFIKTMHYDKGQIKQNKLCDK